MLQTATVIERLHFPTHTKQCFMTALQYTCHKQEHAFDGLQLLATKTAKLARLGMKTELLLWITGVNKSTAA